jgi:hypothetical protein
LELRLKAPDSPSQRPLRADKVEILLLQEILFASIHIPDYVTSIYSYSKASLKLYALSDQGSTGRGRTAILEQCRTSRKSRPWSSRSKELLNFFL